MITNQISIDNKRKPVKYVGHYCCHSYENVVFGFGVTDAEEKENQSVKALN